MNDRQLLLMAKDASEKAYAPYSRFFVGAALECADGSVYTGCNIENAALGSSMCAERTAMYKAISEGNRDFKRMAIFCDSESYCMPCGACRQVMGEFSGELELLCAKGSGSYVSYKLSELLPHAFKFREL